MDRLLKGLNETEIFHLMIECDMCGNDEISIYIDEENSLITLYCEQCKTKEIIEY